MGGGNSKNSKPPSPPPPPPPLPKYFISNNVQTDDSNYRPVRNVIETELPTLPVTETKVYNLKSSLTYPSSSVDKNGTVLLNQYASNMEIQYANNYHVQNEMLQKLKDLQSTNQTKVIILNKQSYNLNWYNWIFLCIYIVFVCIFIFFSFLGKKMYNYSFLFKICICLLFIIFPFIITPLEQQLLKFVSYIIHFFNGSPYISPAY
jgi:uncharacterized membrane protein (DUF485 family)